eukprot:g13662.t1
METLFGGFKAPPPGGYKPPPTSKKAEATEAPVLSGALSSSSPPTPVLEVEKSELPAPPVHDASQNNAVAAASSDSLPEGVSPVPDQGREADAKKNPAAAADVVKKDKTETEGAAATKEVNKGKAADTIKDGKVVKAAGAAAAEKEKAVTGGGGSSDTSSKAVAAKADSAEKNKQLEQQQKIVHELREEQKKETSAAFHAAKAALRSIEQQIAIARAEEKSTLKEAKKGEEEAKKKIKTDLKAEKKKAKEFEKTAAAQASAIAATAEDKIQSVWRQLEKNTSMTIPPVGQVATQDEKQTAPAAAGPPGAGADAKAGLLGSGGSGSATAVGAGEGADTGLDVLTLAEMKRMQDEQQASLSHIPDFVKHSSTKPFSFVPAANNGAASKKVITLFAKVVDFEKQKEAAADWASRSRDVVAERFDKEKDEGEKTAEAMEQAAEQQAEKLEEGAEHEAEKKEEEAEAREEKLMTKLERLREAAQQKVEKLAAKVNALNEGDRRGNEAEEVKKMADTSDGAAPGITGLLNTEASMPPAVAHDLPKVVPGMGKLHTEPAGMPATVADTLAKSAVGSRSLSPLEGVVSGGFLGRNGKSPFVPRNNVGGGEKMQFEMNTGGNKGVKMLPTESDETAVSTSMFAKINDELAKKLPSATTILAELTQNAMKMPTTKDDDAAEAEANRKMGEKVKRVADSVLQKLGLGPVVNTAASAIEDIAAEQQKAQKYEKEADKLDVATAAAREKEARADAALKKLMSPAGGAAAAAAAGGPGALVQLNALETQLLGLKLIEMAEQKAEDAEQKDQNPAAEPMKFFSKFVSADVNAGLVGIIAQGKHAIEKAEKQQTVWEADRDARAQSKLDVAQKAAQAAEAKLAAVIRFSLAAVKFDLLKKVS